MACYLEVLKIPLEIIPEEIIQQYNLRKIVRKGFVYMETQRCMYWLPKAGKIVNDKLKLHLEKFGYDPSLIAPGLWWHQTCPFQFSLVVDDFGIKYELQEDIRHLLMHLRQFIRYLRTGMKSYTVALT